MQHNLPRARVRLIDDAINDLETLQRKDPQIVREVLKKMLLLERAPDAGEPLLGGLVGFRKLIVGNRHYRIVWRVCTDNNHVPVLEIAEVWAAGARADSAVYEEVTKRFKQLKHTEKLSTHPLNEVVAILGRRYTDVEPHPEPNPPEELPKWLSQALATELHFPQEEISALDKEQAQRLLTEHWPKPKES